MIDKTKQMLYDICNIYCIIGINKRCDDCDDVS